MKQDPIINFNADNYDIGELYKYHHILNFQITSNFQTGICSRCNNNSPIPPFQNYFTTSQNFCDIINTYVVIPYIPNKSLTY